MVDGLVLSGSGANTVLIEPEVEDNGTAVVCIFPIAFVSSGVPAVAVCVEEEAGSETTVVRIFPMASSCRLL